MRHARLLSVCATMALASLAACHDDDDDDKVIALGAYDANVDFSAYKTYDVIEPDDVPSGETVPMAYLESNRIAVIQSIVHEMAQRGYVLDEDDPDLLISPMVRLQNVEVTVAKPYWYDYYYGYYWDYAYPWYDVDVVELRAGTLIIDAVDVRDPDDDSDDRLVFRGYVTAVLPDQPTDVSARIRGVVADIFDYWPDVTNTEEDDDDDQKDG
jgi:hypothetical protein